MLDHLVAKGLGQGKILVTLQHDSKYSECNSCNYNSMCEQLWEILYKYINRSMKLFYLDMQLK